MLRMILNKLAGKAPKPIGEGRQETARDRSCPALPRLLRSEERRLVEALIASVVGNEWLASGLEHCLVQEMNDGGMGSLRFVDDGQTDRRFGAAFAEGRFFDEGGVPVSVVLKPG